MTYCATKRQHDEAVRETISEMQADLEKIEANYDALQTPMPCGHLARYTIANEEGTGYCIVCWYESAVKELGTLRRFTAQIMEDGNE